MGEPSGKLTAEEKQAELHDRCRHPTGNWQPVDWRSPQQSIPDRIAAIARSSPDHLAVYDPQTSLTYGQLDRAANQVANAILAERGAGQEVVALLVGVDVPAVTAALGVLKAGKIYVGLEATLPQKRLLQILDDADVELILTTGQHLGRAQELAGSQRQVVGLEQLAQGDARAPGVPVPVDALAILHYTSGSTGLPKGVLQSHRSAYMQAVRYVSYYHMSDADRLVFFQSMATAGAFWFIFGPLCLGATIAPFDTRQYGMHQLVSWLLDTKPTIIGDLTILRQIVYDSSQLQYPSVRLVSTGGDTLFRGDVTACKRAFPNALFATGLGLSEAGRVTELLLDSPQMLAGDIVPLGLPVPGLQIKLVADDGREVAPGEVGEIVVLGPSLAVGYWRRPELTAQKFHSAGSLGPDPAYLTGDLGRQLPDGLLQTMGRKDHMVKIRGYQVYTNEIEALIRQVDGVKEACVVAHKLPEGVQRLVAYLVVDAQAFSGAHAVYARLKDVPAYMVPQAFVFLEALPKTATGKMDRARLPVPERSRLSVAAEYVAPRDLTEKVLARIWSQALSIDGLGIHDNFLELGGHSLDSIRIINQVLTTFKVDISVTEFFSALTIAEMAALVRSAR